ncbi:MAG: hypothetical protein ACQEQ8_02125 [Pseudomonadota bacterium]
MQPAVALFRECWGTKRPTVKNLIRRARQMGYDHLQLHKIADNWWLSLAAEPCCDFVLALSATVTSDGSYAIVAQHIDGPVFIRWADGRLENIQQQPLAMLLNTMTGLPGQTRYLKSGSLPALPDCWDLATELTVDCSASQLLPLSKVRHLSAYKSSRQKKLVALVLLPVVLLAGYFYWQNKGTVEPAQSTLPMAATDKLRLLEPTAVLLAFVRYTEQPVLGAWRLQQVKLQSSSGSYATAQATYQGQPPLAWYQLDDDYSLADNNRLLVEHVERLPTLERSAASAVSADQSASALHRQLLLNPQPGISLHQQGHRLQLTWADVSPVQLIVLAERLANWLLTVEQGHLEPSGLGWNGSLTLAPGQAIVVTDKDGRNET